jgi:hypothetical protein
MSTLLSYFLNQLNDNDPVLHEPLFEVTWGRDIKLRPGVDLSFESTSFQRNDYGFLGGQSATGLPYIAKNTNTMVDVSLDSELVVSPLDILGSEITFTSFELSRSIKLGQPIDVQKMLALKTMYEMGTDQVVYIGDSSIGKTGFLNDPDVSSGNAPNGAGGSPYWVNKTPDEIVKDIQNLIETVYDQTGFSTLPNKIGLPPRLYAYIQATKMSLAADKSIMNYVKENNLYTNKTGLPLQIVDMKYLINLGAANTQRMVAYNDGIQYLRFPMAVIRGEAAYNLGIRFFRPYVWAHGRVEIIYKTTLSYLDGIGATES